MQTKLWVALMSLLLSGAQLIAADAKPNIIIILADDLGFGDLSCYGATKIQTPALDKLASQGVRLLDAHSSGAICQPSRYALLTGRHFWRSDKAVKAFNTRHLHGGMAEMIERDLITLPEFLREQGYATAMVGKWHLGLTWKLATGSAPRSDGKNVDYTQPFAGGPLDHGFDYYFGLAGSGGAPPHAFLQDNRIAALPTEFRTNVGVISHPGVMSPGWRDEDPGPAWTRAVTNYLAQHAAGTGGKPFFLYLALTAPHTPFAPPDFVRGKSQAGPRGDMVMEIDWTVSQVVATLERLGLAEGTLLIVTSDNGAITTGVPAWQIDPVKYGIEQYGHAANGFLRGQKGDLWEGGHRVPFIARWPGKIKPGRTEPRLLCLTDLFATCAAVAGAKLPVDAAADSFNALPLLTGETNAVVRDTLINFSDREMFSMRQENFQLIDGQGSGGFMGGFMARPDPAQPPGQLYDLQTDLAETCNLWNTNPEKARTLRELILTQKKGERTRPAN